MKQYVTHGTGSSQTLSEVQNTNVVVYDTKADAEADLASLAEGQIVATPDTGDELAQPVNEVALNNLHSVTSNAVAQSCCRFPNYADIIVPQSVSWIAPVDCYITVLQIFNYASSTEVYIDGNAVSVKDSQADLGVHVLAFNGFVKKGQRVYYDYLTNTNLCKVFALA